ncbi:MAG: hypothetical protein WKG01_37320, partial [Kofleriaceae bacterium]
MMGHACVIERDPEPLRSRAIRKLPQAPEQPALHAPADEELTILLDPHHRALDQRQVALRLARGDDRELVLATCTRRRTRGRDRAEQATRTGRRTQRCTELHQPLVQIAGRQRRRQRLHQLAGVLPQRLAACGGLDVELDREHAREHASDVAIDQR